VHSGDGLLDSLEVAGQLPDERQQVRVAVEHLVIGGGFDGAAGFEAVAFGGQLGDVNLEPVNACLPVRARFGGEAADDVEDRVDPGLADQGAVAGERPDEVERFECVRGGTRTSSARISLTPTAFLSPDARRQ
jgi:hypothetical protein